MFDIFIGFTLFLALFFLNLIASLGVKYINGISKLFLNPPYYVVDIRLFYYYC
jgi:hypothetical protein